MGNGSLSPHLQDMQKEMDRIKQRQERAMSGFEKRWDLTGKNTIVQPGQSIEVRILPRWDFMDAWKWDGKKWVGNPEYKDGPIYFIALEHWFDTASNQRTRVWCPKSFGEHEPCPICEVADNLAQSSSDDDHALSRNVGAKEVYLFNAMVGAYGRRRLTSENRPDIRCLPASSVIFVGIGQLMTGAGNESFARPVHDPNEGYDLLLLRPKQGSRDRWGVTCANRQTPLYDRNNQQEALVFNGWPTLLIDFPQLVQGGLNTYDELHKMWHGEETPDAWTATSGPPVGQVDPGTLPHPGVFPSGPAAGANQYVPLGTNQYVPPTADPASLPSAPPGVSADADPWDQEFGMPGDPTSSPPPPTTPPVGHAPKPPAQGRTGKKRR